MNATHKARIRQCPIISANAASADAPAFFNLLTGLELFDAVAVVKLDDRAIAGSG